jgi:Heterokaryon incompatibility protein (HET)
MAEPAKYIYKPLLPRKPPTKSESPEGTQVTDDAAKNYLPIRILNLYPGPTGDSLQGELIIRQDESYEALSYYWGETSGPIPPLRIHEKGDVRHIRLTRNLESALKNLRFEHSARKLWIDAICMNQEDKKEKSFQIPFMGRIYSEAKNVCVWLGDPSADSQLAFELIESILELSDLDQLIDAKHTDDWAALSSLMKRDWFSRRWIVQEIAFARSATVHCGQTKIDWSELADAMALFASRADEISKLFRGASKYRHQFDFLGDIEAHGANRLVQTTSRLFRKSDDGNRLQPLLSLESLVSTLSAFKASKPHDIIYAILSLASDTITTAEPSHSRRKRPGTMTRTDAEDGRLTTVAPSEMQRHADAVNDGTSNDPEHHKESADNSEDDQNPWSETQKRIAEKVVWVMQDRVGSKTFHVDYEKKRFYEVCEDFIAFSIKSSQSLDMLCRPWAPDADDLPDDDRDDLPSWICRLSRSPFRPRPDGNYGRVNAELLVGEPQLGPKAYNAARTTAPEFHRFGGRSLFVHGFVLDTVKYMKSPAVEGNIPHEWLAFGGWSKVKEEPPESFWRTLVADRDNKGHNPPSYYRRACKQSFSQRTLGGSLNTTSLINNNERSKTMTNYLKRVQSVVWMKRLMKSEGHNGEQLMGLVPNESEPGDLICIFRGCSVPVVLRKTKDALPEHYHSNSKPVASSSRKFDLSARRRTFPNSSLNGGHKLRSGILAGEREAVSSDSDDVADTANHSRSQGYEPKTAKPHEMMNSQTRRHTEGRAESDVSGEMSDKNPTESKSFPKSRLSVTQNQMGPQSPVMSFKLHIPCHLIGECYIHGMMDGEAFKLRDRFNIDEAEFELR